MTVMKLSVLCIWQWWRCLSSADDSDEDVCPLQMTVMKMSVLYRWQWWRCLSSEDDSDEDVCPLQMTVMKMSVLWRWQWWMCLFSADDIDECVCPLQMTVIERSIFDWRRRLKALYSQSQLDSISWHKQRARYWFLWWITLALFSTSRDPSRWERDIFYVIVHAQRVTKRCRLSLLTNSVLWNTSPYAVGGGSCEVSANEYSCAHNVTWSRNKLWRSTSIFNLCSRPSLLSLTQPNIVAAPLFSSLRALKYFKAKQRQEPQNLPV